MADKQRIILFIYKKKEHSCFLSSNPPKSVPGLLSFAYGWNIKKRGTAKRRRKGPFRPPCGVYMPFVSAIRTLRSYRS